jgi:hypothetical protein
MCARERVHFVDWIFGQNGQSLLALPNPAPVPPHSLFLHSVQSASPNLPKDNMNIFESAALTRLETAHRWLALIEVDDGVPVGEPDLAFHSFLKCYIKELSHGLGLRPMYQNDLQRVQELKDGVRQTNLVYETISDIIRTEESMPNDAQVLLTFLNASVMELAGRINTLERQYPHLSDAFALERAVYAECLEAESF